MPTTNTVLNRIKKPIATFVRWPSLSFTLVASRKTQSKNEGDDLRFDNCSYQAKIVPKDKAVPNWSDSGNDSADWPHDQDSVSTYPLDNIRRTTDIEVA